MRNEIRHLVPSVVNGIPISHTVCLTCVDGKIKAQWSGKATFDCYVCGANTAERSKRWSSVFTDKITGNPVERLELGPSMCHMEVRALEWCIDASTHRDIKSRKIPEGQEHLVDDRLAELQEEAEARMDNLKLSKMASGSHQVKLFLHCCFGAVAYQPPASASAFPPRLFQLQLHLSCQC